MMPLGDCNIRSGQKRAKDHFQVLLTNRDGNSGDNYSINLFVLILIINHLFLPRISKKYVNFFTNMCKIELAKIFIQVFTFHAG